MSEGNFTVIDTGNTYREGAFRFRGSCSYCGFHTHVGTIESAKGSIALHVARKHGVEPKEVEVASKKPSTTGSHGDSGASSGKTEGQKQGPSEDVKEKVARIRQNQTEGPSGA